MKNLPIAVGLAMTSFKGQPLVGLPVALAFILQMLTASIFYRYLIRQPVLDQQRTLKRTGQKTL
jgi:predicted Na+-dependent transporter